MAADGNAYFEGIRHTKAAGRAVVNGNPMLFQEIKRRLSGIRPTSSLASVGHENCSVYSTDQQVVSVTWGWGYNEKNVLNFDLGCHAPAHALTRRTLNEVRQLLPINELVGKETEF
jgi:hypothetical protein